MGGEEYFKTPDPLIRKWHQSSKTVPSVKFFTETFQIPSFSNHSAPTT